MDDTNDTIQYLPIPYRWNLDSRPWLSGTNLFNLTAADIYCPHYNAEGDQAIIPFTGSGITIYVIASLSFNASFAVDGGPAVFINNDYGRLCQMTNPSTCYNTVAYDIQSLTFGNHVLTITAFSFLSGSNSHCHFDYAAVNDTQAAESTITPPSPSTSRTSTLPRPSHRSRTIGVAIGGSVVGVALMAAVVLCSRRRTREQSQPDVEPYPSSFVQSSSPRSPYFPHTEIDANRQHRRKPQPVVQRAPPTSVNTPSVLTTSAAPIANPATAKTSLPSALPETPSPPGSPTANVRLTSEELDFVHDLRSADVPATDIVYRIQRMKTRHASVDEGSSSGIPPPPYDFQGE